MGFARSTPNLTNSERDHTWFYMASLDAIRAALLVNGHVKVKPRRVLRSPFPCRILSDTSASEDAKSRRNGG